MTTQKERKHMNAVSELGCAMCRHIHGPHAPGPVELHHLRTGGWGKGNVNTLIPLCVNHHRGKEGIHHIGTKLWEREFGITQQQLLDWTLAQVGDTN